MMYLIYLIYNIFIFAGIFAGYFYVTKKFTLKFIHSRQKFFIWLLLLVHGFFSLAFYLYSSNSPSDAIAYYDAGLITNDWFSLFGMGAYFMKFITFPLVKLQVSYFNINLIFSVFGLYGFYNLYYLLIKRAHSDDSKIHWGANVLFLLPTFHFYTSGISKDNLIFFSITTLLTYICFKKKFNSKLILILILIFFIRSYLLVLLMVTYGFYMLLLSNVNFVKRITIFLFGVSILIFIEPVISQKLNIEIFSFESLDRFLERVQTFGTNVKLGGSIIDSSEMSVFRRMFSYSYLPLIWESNSILKHLTSLENFLLLYIFVKFLFSKGKFKLFTKSDVLIKLCLIYSLLTWFIMSFTLYNLGLSTRQKYVYIPYLYFAIFLHFKKIKDSKDVKIL
ncbi:hypothetical protein OAX11_04835 [Flavobacteriaceae bacterium]|nr:hypothetical protein [Flavobacteriaceae bacterium]